MVNTLVDDSDTGYDTGWIQDQSPYQDVMKAPIIQENAVDDDSTNGICVLFDYSECLITWQYNEVPIIQCTYPRDGKFIKELKPGRIIIGDVNRLLTHQKFRINEVLRSDQSVVVNGSHILGEYLSANPIKGDKISGANMNARMVADQILSNTARPVPEINFDSDVEDVKTVNIDTSSVNALNALIDPDQQGDTPVNSLLANFGGEFIFDNFTIYHRKHAGRKLNISVTYGKNLQNWQQDKNIAETYVGIYPYATYQPQPAQATEENVDWAGIADSQHWSSIGSVTYSAGGYIDVYDAPIAGAKVIRQIDTGQQIKLGTPINDGDSVPRRDNPDQTVVVKTVNGDQWYPIAPEDGGGWVDAAWINFDKTGDYIVNDAFGHVTIDAKAGQTLNRYKTTGTATVTYPHGAQLIHVYYAPDPGPDHYRRKKKGKDWTFKNGTKIHYDYVAIDENGKSWYRIGDHAWLYGDHLSLTKNGDVQTYPSSGMGLVKKNAKKYKINIHTGKVDVEYQHLSLTQAKKQHKKPYKTVLRGKGKKRKPVNIKNPDYQKGKALTHKHKYYKLDYGQVVIAGTLYYKLSDGSYVKASDIDTKARKTSKPKSPSKIQSEWADQKGKVEIYSAPSKGSAINWSIPDGKSFAVDKTAQGADGKTWYQVTYEGRTGWIPAESTSTTAPDDLEPQAKDETSTAEDADSTQSVDDTTVMVQLDDSFDNVYNGVYYPPGVTPGENAHILKLDLSSYIQHDDDDQSGLQSDGSWQATASDKQQLYQVTQSAAIQNDIGHFPVSITASYADLDGDKADLLALSMYDTITARFPQYDSTEEVEITGTVWRMQGQDSHYDSVNIGDLPKTYEHLLLEKANQQTQSTVARSNKKTRGLLAEYDAMLAQEGSNRFRAEKKLMKDLGLIQDITTKQGKQIENQLVTNQEFESKMNSIQATADDIKSWTLSQGSGVIQAVPNWQNPTMLTATNPSTGTKMAFTGNGLVFYNADGTQRLRAGMDSNGEIYADSIKGGTIDAVSINSCVINSALHFSTDNTTMQIYIGTVSPTQTDLVPWYGGRVIWITSNNYQSMFSSGQLAIKDMSSGSETRVHPSYISIGHEGNAVLTQENFIGHAYNTIKRWVEGWIADYITIKGVRKDIWLGKDEGHNSGSLP